MKKCKQVLSIFLALLMLVMSVPLAFAEGETCPHSNLTYIAEGEDSCFNYTLDDYCVCIEHWYCEDCWCYFADEAATQELTYDHVYTIPCPHRGMTHFEEGEYSRYNDNDNKYYVCIEHWCCDVCGRYFADAEGTQELDYDQIFTLPCPHNDMRHYAEGEDVKYGNFCVEHWFCSVCWKYFADEAATQELTYDQVYSISCQHNNLVHYAEGEEYNSSCNGYLCIEHWYCEDCHRYYADAAATQSLMYSEIYTIPCTHPSFSYYAEGSKHVWGGGNELCVEHWRCEKCSQCFADENATQPLTLDEVYSILCPHNSLRYCAEGSSRGQTADGNEYLCIEHWHCDDCELDFEDQNATQSLTFEQLYSVPYSCPHNNLRHHAEGEVGGQGYVCVEHWYCEDCGQYFADAAATQKLTHDQVYTIPCPHTNVSYVKSETPICGGTGKREYWSCQKCYQYFADEAATQPLTYDQLTITASHSAHKGLYEVGFADEGNGHPWLGTTSLIEKEYQAEYGMTVAQKFASDGYSAWHCDYCGVFIEAEGEEKRPKEFDLFVNPIPELAGSVKLPTSPTGLAAGGKWIDFGSYLNLSVPENVPEEELGWLAFIIYFIARNDYYFNETTQKLISLTPSGEVNVNGLLFLLRSVGDEENAVALPTSPTGLAAGQKWFDAASFYQDVMTKYVPENDEDRDDIENFMNKIASASFSLSADGSTVYAKGRNPRIGEIFYEEEQEALEEMGVNFNGGNWFVSINSILDLLEVSSANASSYVKTVEGGACAHVWNEGRKTKDPSCTVAGIRTYTCTLCGTPREEIIPALGHKWDGGFPTKAPTQTDTGICTYTCTVCNVTKDITVSRLDPTSLLNDLNNKEILKDTADNATVFFDAGANLPADTIFDYEIIAESKFFQIFDLTLTSGGKEIEPEAPVWVKLPLPKDWKWNPDHISVWHGDQKLPSYIDGGYIYFLTTHFSEFQFKYEEEKPEEPKPDNNDNNDNTDNQPSGKVCKFCGQVHNGFFQKIIGFFHSILALFGLKKK